MRVVQTTATVVLLVSVVLGGHARAQPQEMPPPPPIVAPPPVMAPAQLPPPYLPQMQLGDGWRTVIDETGHLVAERRTSQGNHALWVTGLGLFVLTPVIGAIASAKDTSNNLGGIGSGIAFAPVIGPLVNAGLENGDARRAGWGVASALQASGLVMLIVGAVTGPQKIERIPLRFSAGVAPNGDANVGVVGRF